MQGRMGVMENVCQAPPSTGLAATPDRETPPALSAGSAGAAAMRPIEIGLAVISVAGEVGALGGSLIVTVVGAEAAGRDDCPAGFTVGGVVGVNVEVAPGTLVAVDVGVAPSTLVAVAVGVAVGRLVGVDVGVLVSVDVGVAVEVDVGVAVGVDVGVAVAGTPGVASTGPYIVLPPPALWLSSQ
jgi:hypothetical protein